MGDAQVIVTGLSPTLLRLEAQHLTANRTLPPEHVHLPIAEESEELEIDAPQAPDGDEIPNETVLQRLARRGGHAWRHPATRAVGFGVMMLLLAGALLLSQLRGVRLQLEPARPEIHTPGTFLALHLGSHLYLLPGDHVVRATHVGYIASETLVHVTRAHVPGVRLVLPRLPGVLVIDTDGIAASISIDGVASGQAPGTVRVPAGAHTLTLRAPRYVDDIESVTVAGGGQQQRLSAKLRPSWGTVQILSNTPEAQVKVDGVEHGICRPLCRCPRGCVAC